MAVKISRIECLSVPYPTRGRFKFFEDARGRPLGRPSVLVRIEADNGAVGYGQSVPVPKWSYETPETVVSTIRNYLAPALIGADVYDIEGIHERMDRAIAPSFSIGQPICKAGVDLAVHDLVGRIEEKSVRDLWGLHGKKEWLELSWTLNPRSLGEVEGLIAEGKAEGHSNFNVKVAPDPAFDIELCKLVKTLAPETFLWADANGGYTEEAALAAAPKLADAGVDVLEQPLPANHLTGYRKLKKQGALPIILDEGVVSHRDLIEFHDLGLLDGVAMKPARCAGLLEAKKQVEILRERELWFLGSGLTDPDFSLAAALQLYAAFDLDRPAALNGPQFLAASFLKAPWEIREGKIRVPRGPGLGVELDEGKLAEMLDGESPQWA